MEKYITQNGIKYELHGEQYYPMLEIAEQKEHQIGKYGLLHRDYIKQHKRGTYITLLTEGKINAHLHEIDVQANSMVEAIVANLARERGIDEELKASDTLKWVCGLLYCADCGSPLWFNVCHPNTSIQYFNCSNYRSARGTCPTTHYIRADSLEQIVLCELRRLAEYLTHDEEAFADLLEQKTNKDMIRERKALESTLQTATARNNEVSRLYERVYEDNVNGKITDERFMQLSNKYDTEQAELKKQIVNIQEQLARLDEMKTSKDNFIKAVRRFMEMQTLTPAILHELIDRIEVHHVVGVGKSRVQQIIIHYRFVGCVEIPDAPQVTHTQDTRQGVCVTYEAIAG